MPSVNGSQYNLNHREGNDFDLADEREARNRFDYPEERFGLLVGGIEILITQAHWRIG